jgi:enoyl-CoA hydratase
MDFENLIINSHDEIMTVTVNRPDALNALSVRTLTELKQLLVSLIADDGYAVRGVVLTGAGDRAFIAGADIREMAVMTPDEGEAFGRLGQEVTRLLEDLPVPVIACVNGYALGGGCEMAIGCDYIYATENAVFGQPEVALGLIPGFGGCVRLQRYVGPARAKEMIYTGRKVDAQEALRIGLANRVFPTRHGMLDAAAESLREIARRSPVAVSLCKQTINAANGQETPAALEIETAAFRQAFTTDDMREGTQAFMEKRTAMFPAGRA